MKSDFRGDAARARYAARLRGHARLQPGTFVRFTADETAETLCSCVREALIRFGGVPRQVRFDNAKTVVVERDAYGEGSTTVSTARDVSGLEIRRNAFRLQRFGVGVPCTKTRVPHDVSNRAHNSTDHSGEG